MSDSKQRILAIDYGSVRIGLAISDPLGIFASGLGTIDNSNTLITELQHIIEENNVGKVVVGLPLTLKGTEGDSATEVREFIDALEAVIDLPIVPVDERLTSAMAANTIREMGIGKKKREKHKGKVDELAAVHLLQGYLQSQPSGF